MAKKQRRAVPACLLASALAASAVLALGSGAAHAAQGTQAITGIPLEVIAIAGTPTAFSTGFAAGQTATTTGTLVATDTNPGFNLTVQDTASAHPGHMVAAGTGCTGSVGSLLNPLSVSVTSPLGGVHSDGPVGISGAAQAVASATAAPLAASVLTTNYSQTLAAGEDLLTGCVYSLTATYTLQ
jgi:hypothetical protein